MTTQAPKIAEELIVSFEGFEPKWYRDVAGYWTLGYGLREGVIGLLHRDKVSGPISKKEGLELLRAVLDEVFTRGLREQLDVFDSLHVYKRAALLSLVYNIGLEAFRTSTLRQAIERRSYLDTMREWSRWRYSTIDGKKQVVDGLVRRREVESTLWAQGWELARRSLYGHRVIKLPVLDVEPGEPLMTLDELKAEARSRLERNPMQVAEEQEAAGGEGLFRHA